MEFRGEMRINVDDLLEVVIDRDEGRQAKLNWELAMRYIKLVKEKRELL
jgi:hypothetical protein